MTDEDNVHVDTTTEAIEQEAVSNWTFDIESGFNLELEKADPETCEHEWWEDTQLIYTSSPPAYRQVCRLCGDFRFRYGDDGTVSARWIKVED